MFVQVAEAPQRQMIKDLTGPSNSSLELRALSRAPDRHSPLARLRPPRHPAAAMKPKAPEPQRKKPDAFQERILKGDFYMD
ncbi:hypothetical protein HYQ46_009963 [Verticillium longisporum]|nr:hypothetical protein HYQ46_009963 [Verticillium longisporum]